jgi:drug/metabolite transporter (DMT)-like permease
LALLIPVFASVGHLLVKKYGQSESVYSFLIIGKLILILISGVITFELYIPMTKTDFFLNFNSGLLRGMGMIFIINSARHLPASIFANTQYIQLLIGALIGFYIFNEIPTWNIYLGNVFIIGAGIYIVLREIKLSRNIVSNSIRPTTISIKK